MAEPGPLIAMKLQAVMNRSADKQGTDLLDIVHLTYDASTRPSALAQIAEVDPAIANDMALHVELWFMRHRQQALSSIRNAGGDDIAPDDVALVAELLLSAARRRP